MENKKIIICEDDNDARFALTNILTKRKAKVFEAKDGLEAVEKTKEINPDLLVLDIRMPKLSGIEAAAEIRKFNENVKIIFLTAFQSTQISNEAKQYDIFDYLVKPADPEKVIEAVQKALA